MDSSFWVCGSRSVAMAAAFSFEIVTVWFSMWHPSASVDRRRQVVLCGPSLGPA